MCTLEAINPTNLYQTQKWCIRVEWYVTVYTSSMAIDPELAHHNLHLYKSCSYIKNKKYTKIRNSYEITQLGA